MFRLTLATGAAIAVAARAALPHLLLRKFNRALAGLNGGDHRALLSTYADDAVLRFHDGNHRWAGDWIGKPNIDRFLQNFTAAGLQGTIVDLAVSGPPWAMKLMVRFDDHANGPDGEWLYENHTVLVLRTRWGKVIEHEDFYADTDRIAAFDRRLTALGIAAVSRAPGDTPSPTDDQ